MVRGVDSGYSVTSLQEKGLIEQRGRLDVPGKPFTYRTTDNFLRVFGISSIDDLPPLESFSDDEEDSELVVESTDTPAILDLDENDEETIKENDDEQA